MAGVFNIVPTNPNVQGGGCLCHPNAGGSATEGPFAVFFAACTDEMLSPHAVVCAPCIREATAELAAAPTPVPKRRK